MRLGFDEAPFGCRLELGVVGEEMTRAFVVFITERGVDRACMGEQDKRGAAACFVDNLLQMDKVCPVKKVLIRREQERGEHVPGQKALH